VPSVEHSVKGFFAEILTLPSAALGKAFFAECPTKGTRQRRQHSAKPAIPVVTVLGSSWASWVRGRVCLATLTGDLSGNHWMTLRALLPLYRSITTCSIKDGWSTASGLMPGTEKMTCPPNSHPSLVTPRKPRSVCVKSWKLALLHTSCRA
jgi:hypothetical protein